jgi:hypothetical protein
MLHLHVTPACAVPHGRPHSLPRKSQDTEDAAAAAAALFINKKRKTDHHEQQEQGAGAEEPAVPSAAWQEVTYLCWRICCLAYV